jgi:hypothetical protein
LTLELSDFVHLSREEFDTIYWLDVATPPGGRTIRMKRQLKRNPDGGVRSFYYEAGWGDVDLYLLTDEGQVAAPMKLSEALDLAAADAPEMTAIQAVTTYQVKATLAEESVEYRAAVFWQRTAGEAADSPAQPDFVLVDNVTVGVAEAYFETIEPVRLRRPGPWTEAPSESGLKAMVGKSVFACEEPITNRSVDRFLFLATDHTNGGHGPFFRPTFTCQCMAECMQDCYVSIAFEACQEAGIANSCHKLSFPSVSANFGFSFDTNNSAPASCKAAIGCSWKSCFACLCGTPSVSVGISGGGASAGVSYSNSPGSNLIGIEVPHYCSRCPDAGYNP